MTANPYNKFVAHTPTYDLLWPERRRVFGSQIRMWYSDAIANGQLDLERDGTTLTTDGMALALHLAGLITLKRDGSIFK